ncbi:Conserved_hypothetical protein [Hexamita inflata]|uniref:Uncharacterized protein n=1 Tax=Hexamita inflata TaxID=28002 RepID=A0AA86UQS0_9EUKA|nr:Conserved hypothetical protein [Hexamita inflata]
MILILSFQTLIKMKQDDIVSISKQLANQIDNSVQQFKQLLNQNTLSDYFEPTNQIIQVGSITKTNREKWNNMMNITQHSHEILLHYLLANKQFCFSKKLSDAQQRSEFNNRIVDTDNLDVTFEDDNCLDTSLLDEIKTAAYNSLFPESINQQRAQNSYQTILLSDLTRNRQYRFPASGNGFQNVNCIQDQFNELQQIIIGYSSYSEYQFTADQNNETQNYNRTIQYNNSIVFEDRCIGRSVRVFCEKQQHYLNQIPQILSGDQINEYISKSKLMQPNITQIIYSLDIISQELLAAKEKVQFHSNITAKTTFRPTEILIIADCVSTFQQRVILKYLNQNKQLFDTLQILNVNVNFQPLIATINKNCQSLDYFKQHPIFKQNNNLIKNGFKLVPAKMDELGQMSFSLCTLNGSFIICSQIPQKAFLLQPGAQVLLEKFGQVLITNRNNYLVHVDSFNQNVGLPLQNVCQDINQSILNIIQTNTTTNIRYNNTFICTGLLDNNLLYVLYLQLPASYTTVQPNTKTMPALQFTADKLCFNQSFQDEQCTNKLNIYFPENYIGNNKFAPADSIYMKGVKINSNSSKILANFLQNEYVFGKTVYPTYQNIFQEPVSSAAFFVFALAQQQSFDNLQQTYNFIKQRINDIFYVGRSVVPGIISIYPDNKLTSKTVKLITNISIDSIINNVISNSSIVIKEFECEFYTETGIIVDKCVYIGIPFTNFLGAQDFFVVRKAAAFQLFLQNDMELQLFKNNLNFYIASNSSDSLYYQQTQNSIRSVQLVLFEQGYGQCEYSEINNQIVHGYVKKPNLFKEQLISIDSNFYQIIQMNYSKSVLLVFNNNLMQQTSIICNQIKNQTIINDQNDNLINEWSQQFNDHPQKHGINIKILVIYSSILVLISLICA